MALAAKHMGLGQFGGVIHPHPQLGRSAMTRQFRLGLGLVCTLMAAPCVAAGITRTSNIVGDGKGTVGTLTVSQAPRGVLLRVEASGLTPGWHGMHIHSLATCADAGLKA